MLCAFFSEFLLLCKRARNIIHIHMSTGLQRDIIMGNCWQWDNHSSSKHQQCHHCVQQDYRPESWTKLQLPWEYFYITAASEIHIGSSWWVLKQAIYSWHNSNSHIIVWGTINNRCQYHILAIKICSDMLKYHNNWSTVIDFFLCFVCSSIHWHITVIPTYKTHAGWWYAHPGVSSSEAEHWVLKHATHNVEETTSCGVGGWGWSGSQYNNFWKLIQLLCKICFDCHTTFDIWGWWLHLSSNPGNTIALTSY